jgi:hypothetical protein
MIVKKQPSNIVKDVNTNKIYNIIKLQIYWGEIHNNTIIFTGVAK